VGAGHDLMDCDYLPKYEIWKQLYSSEHSFLSPCRSKHSGEFYQPVTSLKLSTSKIILQKCKSRKQ
jgi:hypothetical protein